MRSEDETRTSDGTDSVSAPPDAGSGASAGVEHLPRSALLVGLGEDAPAILSALQSEDLVAGIADRPRAGLDAARRLRPDLVVLREPAWNPGAFVEKLRATEGVGHILVLVRSPDPEAALALLARGADDVVPPPHDPETVLLRARLARGRTAVQSTLPHPFRTIRIEESGEGVFDDDGPIELKGRSLELLRRLLEAGGEVVHRKTLLRDIWGSEETSVTVLDATVHRLRKRLEANPGNPKIVTTVRGVGYRLEIARVEVI